MNRDMVVEMSRLCNKFGSLYNSGLVGVSLEHVQVTEEFYRENLLHESGVEHKYEKNGGWISVTCVIDGTNFLALFEPRINSSLADLI